MKTTYTLFLSLLLCLLFIEQGQAQHYQSIFGKQSTSWVFRWANLPGAHQDTVFADKDTIVNNLNYKKLVISTYAPYSIGLLREDSVAGKVWYKSLGYYDQGIPNPNDTIEHLAFDFGLNKGDTFDISSSSIGVSYPITWNIVDSIYYLNGKKYILFSGPNSPREPVTLIEGIGGNYGIIWKHYVTYFQGQYLLCSYKDGVRTDYVNKQYNGNCYINSQVGVEEEFSKSKIEVYPNPVQDILTIKAPQNIQIKHVIILNVLGQGISKINYPDSNQSISIANLSSGLYFIKVLLNDNSVSHHKILKIN